MVLDTLHFSGGYTSFETIWAQTPFVTQRGAYMRGRVTAGLCDLLGLDECLATGAADYAARAIALAGEHQVREQLIEKMASRKHQLLALDDSVLPAFNAFFQRALLDAEHARTREAVR